MSSDERLRRLDEALTERQLDGYLATKTADIRWLTGFSRVFDEEQAHALLATSTQLGPDPLRLLHTDMRYSSAMRRLADGVLDVLDDERKAHSQFVVEQLGALLGGGGGEVLRIGIEADLPLSSYRALVKALDEAGAGEGGAGQLRYELVELPGLIEGLRAVKDEAEIAAMKAAQEITDAAFTHMLGFMKAGVSEAEAAVELEFFMRRMGSEGVSFGSIIGSGPNAANPHAVVSERRFEPGDLVVMDFGARLDDYRSDMTRTVAIGRASERQREIYATVLEAQLESLAMVGPGVALAAPAERVNEIFAEHGFEALSHGLGHGVGIDIHESPVLNPKSEGALEVGHVVTIEPGIYIEGDCGVRIEDYGAVSADGFDNFTASSKELFEL